MSQETFNFEAPRAVASPPQGSTGASESTPSPTFGRPSHRQLEDGRHELVLAGCAPRPLAHYLKAVGLLRLVAEQRDADASGRWHDDQFILTSQLSADDFERFLLHEYRPTPVNSPWNGGSGFYASDNSTALLSITNSDDPRFGLYRRTLEDSRKAMEAAGYSIEGKSKDNDKRLLIQMCRNLWPDESLAWLDAAIVLTNDDARYPPLLGTGGNDGRLDFSNNFMQRVLTVLLDGPPSASQLGLALYGGSVDVLQSKAAIGQFFPGAAGGANNTTGFDSESLTNPWDFVLMIEGALVMAASAIRQMPADERGAISAPFTVRTLAAGYGGANDADANAGRAELWLPLWDRDMSWSQLELLFSEGRIATGRGIARDGMDALSALSRHAFIKGLTAFERYGLMERNGLAYFATPLGRLVVRDRPASQLLVQTQAWSERILRQTADANAPLAVARAGRHLRETMFQLEATSETQVQLLEREYLHAIADLQAQMATSFRWTSKGGLSGSDSRRMRPPLPALDRDWLKRIGDNSAEFWLAASLASVATRTRDRAAGPLESPGDADQATSTGTNPQLLDMRPYLAPLDTQQVFRRTGALSWLESPDNDQVWTSGRVVDGLLAILHRRMLQHSWHGMHAWEWPANRSLVSTAGSPRFALFTPAPLWAVQRFLDNRIDEPAFERWLRCCMLVRPGFALVEADLAGPAQSFGGSSAEPDRVAAHQGDHRPTPDVAWILAKLAFAGAAVPVADAEVAGTSVVVPLDASIASAFAGGQGEQGVRRAMQRLRSSGLPLAPLQPWVSPERARRIAAALLFPISDTQIAKDLLPAVLRPADSPDA
jgi:CRISPR-associated protein Csx17